MSEKITNRKIVIVNQAVNYLTIGICNEFAKKFEEVSLITGSIHTQGEELKEKIEVTYINKWKEEHGIGKFLIYLKALWKIYFSLRTTYRKHEVFFISVPPLAYLLNLLVPNKFSMIIWDVYPDVFKITGMNEKHIIYRIWAKLNKYSFKKAFRLFTIGERMADLLSVYIAREKIIIQPIWSIFQKNSKKSKKNNPFIRAHNLQDKFIVQYSGNIGLTHKVELMVKLAERMQDHGDILFQIIGRGPRVPLLKKMVAEKKLANCQFLPFQPDEMFPYSLSAADLGVVILDELTSKGSVPSKSYNLMSFGIPSLYFAAVDSELKNYSDKYGHAKCFTEKELEKAIAFIAAIKNNKQLYKELEEKSLNAAGFFKRDNATKFVEYYIAAN
ncbi:MAG: glycosyltransferase family 4 protein [Flavobacteriaceae bacterium]|nr:glycosyltransferase family 4 protein [Flavobacteriaceae bacterium]